MPRSQAGTDPRGDISGYNRAIIVPGSVVNSRTSSTTFNKLERFQAGKMYAADMKLGSFYYGYTLDLCPGNLSDNLSLVHHAQYSILHCNGLCLKQDIKKATFFWEEKP